MYKTLNEHYREKFGCKVYKLSLDGGMTCPNRDGEVGVGGCIFCSGKGSGDFAERQHGTLLSQLESAKNKVENKCKSGKYIAYFQSFTNTYADLDYLRKLYYEAISPDYVVGLSIATRPDCLPDETVGLIKEINAVKPVSVELGLQTVHDKTAEYIGRGYKSEVYFDAVRRLKEAGIEVVTHIIIGLPGETEQMTVETARRVGQVSDGIKFHLLYVLKNTRLEKDYYKGLVKELSLEEYGDILKKCIEAVPEDVVIHRITGDGAKKDLIAPKWSADKKRVLNYLKTLF